ncbi:MAG: hypothetical protein GHCLOJNM_00064 [bacterium]|nr:hypothetical protein [bacterium]
MNLENALQGVTRLGLDTSPIIYYMEELLDEMTL